MKNSRSEEPPYIVVLNHIRLNSSNMTTVTGQDANMAGRVRAAAQLVLQDLDPEARKRRQEFMSGEKATPFCRHYFRN